MQGQGQDLIHDAEIDERKERMPSLAVLSDLNTSNLEDRVRNAAKEMAKKIFESSVDGIDNMNQIVVATTSSIAKSKTEGMVFLYIIITEIAALDKSGDIASVFLQKGIVKKVYQVFGNTIDDLYRDRKGSLQVYNSKAYLIDAFVSDFFPLYSNGEIVIPSGGMTGELIYPDGFLNIFFRAVKKCFENDKVMVEEVLKHQAMLSNADSQSEKERVLQIVQEIFNRETTRVLSLFNQSDKVRIMQYLQGKIDELLKLSEDLSDRHPAQLEKNKSLEAVEETLASIHKKISDLGAEAHSEPEQLKNIDKNVVLILEKQIMLLNRVEELQNPEKDDFLSEMEYEEKSTQNASEELLEIKNKIDVLSEEVARLPMHFEKMLSQSDRVPIHEQMGELEGKTEKAILDPYDVFGDLTQEESPAKIVSIDYEKIGQIIEDAIKNGVAKSIASMSDRIEIISKEIHEVKEHIELVHEVSADTNRCLKEEITATAEFIEHSKQKD